MEAVEVDAEAIEVKAEAAKWSGCKSGTEASKVRVGAGVEVEVEDAAVEDLEVEAVEVKVEAIEVKAEVVKWPGSGCESGTEASEVRDRAGVEVEVEVATIEVEVEAVEVEVRVEAIEVDAER